MEQNRSISMEDIGERLLSQKIESDDKPFIPETEEYYEVYRALVSLSHEISPIMSRDDFSDSSLDLIYQYVDELELQLKSANLLPNSNIGPCSQAFEAYKLLSYTFLLFKKLDIFQNDPQNKTITSEYSLDNSRGYSPKPQVVQKRLHDNEKITELSSELAKLRQVNQELLQYKDLSMNCLRNLIYRYQLPQNTDFNSLEENLIQKNIPDLHKGVPKYIEDEREINEDLRKEINKLTEQYIQSQNQVSELNSNEQRLKDEIYMLKSQLNKNQIQIDHTDESIAKIVCLESDLAASNHHVSTMTRENKTLKAKVKLCKDENLSLQEQINSLNLQLENTQMENHKLRLQQADPPSKIEIPHKDYQQEIKKLNQVIEMLSLQMEQQTKELINESTSKNQLVEIIEKQFSLLNQYEGIANTRSNEINELREAKSTLRKVQAELDKVNSHRSHLVKGILDYTSSALSEKHSNYIMNIMLNSDTSDEENIVNTLKYIINISPSNEHHGNSQLEMQNKKLYSYVSSQIRFLQMLANNDNVKTIILEDGNEDSMKNLLIQQAARVDRFLRETAPGLLESPNIFQAFQVDVEPKQFIQHVRALLNSKVDPKEMLLITEEAIAINDILRKYLQQIKTQNTQKSNELQRIRNESNQLSREIHIERHENKKKEAYYMKMLNNTRNAIRQSLKLGYELPNIFSTISHAIHKCQDFELGEIEPPDPSRNDPQIECLSEKLDEINQQRRLLKHRNKEMSIIIASANSSIEEMSNQIHELEKQLAEASEVVELAHKENERLQEEIKRVSNVRNSYDDQQSTATNRMQREHDAEMHEINKQMEEIKMACAQELAKIKQSNHKKVNFLKSQLQIALDESNTQKERADNLKSQYEPMFKELKAKLQEMRDNKSDIALKLANAESELQQTKSKISTLTIENRMLKVKINSNDETNKRNQAMLENQLRLKQIATVTEKQRKIEDIEEERQRFYFELAKILSISGTEIDESILIEKIKDILQELKDFNKKEIEWKSTKLEIERAQRFFGLPSSSMLSSCLSDVINKMKSIIQENQLLHKELDKVSEISAEARASVILAQQAKEWEDWGSHLYSMVSDSCSVKSSKEIRYDLEEMLLAATGVRSNAWKLESLRTQKRIILAKKSHIRAQKKVVSIFPIIMMTALIRRAQKLSGHLKTQFSIPATDENDQRSDWPVIQNDESLNIV